MSRETGTMYTLTTMSEDAGLVTTLHETDELAYENLRQVLNLNPVSYQDPLPKDATQKQIEDAADDRSQFAWVIEEHNIEGLLA